ncbi:Bud site selection protein bud4 [Rhodotorula kratochvilovae]
MAALSSTPAPPSTRDDPPTLRSPLVLSTRSFPGPDGPAPRPASVLIQNVRGAEGGVEAITARRRNSGSFKTMSTGGLVSNSPFAKRLGQAASPIKPAPALAPPINHGLGLYTSSRIPTVAAGGSSGRRSSGSRKASGEHDGPVKENSYPSELNELASGKSDDARSRSTSPGVPFRPVRQQAAPSSTSAPTPFKPSRPAFGGTASQDEADQPRRQTSSYAHLRKNNLVSSSPFTAQQAPSPELRQAPYEIGALALESAPMEYFHVDGDGEHSPHLPAAPAGDKSAQAVGLGARPGQGMPTAARHVAGASAPPAAAAAWRYSGEVASPPPSGSSMSPVRRGMRGPRPLDAAGEERDELSRTVRRQPSSKSVAWAETEEVFEFEVEEERRRSMMSDASTLSDEGRYYGGGGGGDGLDSSEEEEDSFTGAGHASYSFEEGGSVEVHDIGDGGSDAEDSVVSNTSSAMDEVIGQIDSYLHEESYDETDVFSPSQIPSFSDGHDQPDLPSHRTTPGYSSPQVVQAPMSAFSVSTASGADDGGSDVMSTSAYDDDEDEDDDAHFAATRNAILARGLATIPQTPMSPPRPPLPSPPMSRPPPAADPIPSSLLAHSDSQFSLPDIPGTSPFLGFEDDGAAESVVSLSSGAAPRAALPIPTTRPLSLLSQTSTPVKAAAPEPAPEESTPTKATPGLKPSSSVGSPILSTMHRSSDAAAIAPGSASPALSRKASLVGSDVTTSSTSWYVSSVTGSLRGGRLGGGLESAMKRHEALLGSPFVPSSASLSSSTSSARPSVFGAFPAASPAPSSSTRASPGKSTPPTSHSGSDAAVAPLSPSRAIEARPAPKAWGATLSSGMLPTIAASAQRTGLVLGAPLTSSVAEDMQSPLERLQAGMKGREGAEWRSGDSLLGVAEEEDEDEVDEVGSLRPRKGEAKRLTRRRSRSTGDADLAETTSSIAMQPQHTMPELGFEQRAEDAAFGSSVLESLDDIYNSRNRTYRVRESKHLVVVSDFGGSKAGDVDPGRAWRKKRPSDVHAINRSFSTMSVNSQAVRKNREFAGQLFVLIREASFEGMPLPRSKVMVTAALDNGRQCVNVAVRELSSKVQLRKEFELVCNQDLAFSIKLSVPAKAPVSTPVVPAPAPSPAPTPPASPSKTHRAFRLFSSPKKKAAPIVRPVATPSAPPPTPDPFYDYVSADGQLASARVTFASEAAACRLKKSRVVVPFVAAGAPRACKGTLTLDLLFVPTVQGVPKANLPKSMDQVLEGLELADWASKITHESVLTQLGGDTTVWRRRIVKLRGSTLVPYSEVTKRSHVEINLAHVVAIEDLNAPSSSRASRYGDDDDDEALSRMDHSFRLTFRDGNRIDFYADSDAIKEKWLEVLADVVGKEDDKKTAPDWAIAVRKLPAPKTLLPPAQA